MPCIGTGRVHWVSMYSILLVLGRVQGCRCTVLVFAGCRRLNVSISCIGTCHGFMWCLCLYISNDILQWVCMSSNSTCRVYWK